LSTAAGAANTAAGASNTNKSLAARVAEIVGFKVTTNTGVTYEVKQLSSGVGIAITSATSGAVNTISPASGVWPRVAMTVLSLKKTGGKTFRGDARTAATPKGSTNRFPGVRGTTGTSTGTDAGAGAGSDAGTGTQLPAWAATTYISDMMALVGKTFPSNIYPTRTFTIKTATLDGLDAPVITVADTASGTVDVDPKNVAWVDTASQVLAASYAAASGSAGSSGGASSGGASSGGASSGGASSGGGTMVVVTDTSTPTVVTPEQALADEAVNTVDEALAPAPEVMTVSTDAAKATGEEGFFSKYKWWLLGGAAIVAYTQREAIMKMVKK
jgi:hypothetical protein